MKLFDHFLTEYSFVYAEIYCVSSQIMLGFFHKISSKTYIWNEGALARDQKSRTKMSLVDRRKHLAPTVGTNLPIQKVLQKPDVAGRMVRWAVKLLEFHIQYEPRGSIKGQVYANFVAELSPRSAPQEVELGSQWMLSVDGSSNQQGSGAGIILEGPNGC